MLNGTKSAKELAEALNAERHHYHWMACCPAHEDDKASLAIREKNGRVLVHCHAGCTQDAVLAALRGRNLWPERRANGAANGKLRGSRTVVAVYEYVDELGEPLFQVIRFKPKDFRQRRRPRPGDPRDKVRDGWVWSVDGVPVVPYRLPETLEAIANQTPIFIVEGEEDANNLAKLGIVATCNAGGAGKWKPEHATRFTGADATVIPDNDEAGRQHAESVAASLTGTAARVRILTLPGLQPKGDVSDWIAAGGTPEQLWKLREQAPGWQPRRATQQTRPRSTQTAEGDPPHWLVEPWSQVVSGAELLDAICTILRRYMVLPKMVTNRELHEHAADAMALWTLHAWTIEAWEISPLLIVVSPTKQCGKSTLLTILYWMTPRSELISNATASPIFRLIQDAKPAVPTFLLDEGDSYLKPDKEDLRGILNSGWMRAGARVIRTDDVGGERRARRFSTWAPKVIATIKAVADTLMDRGVIITI